MYLIYCDESNLDAHEYDFFIYGGITIDCETALEFSNRLEEIRATKKISEKYLLKYAPRPDNLNVEEFNMLKQEFIETAVKYGSKLIISIIHRSIMTNVETARLNEINRVAYHFNNYLISKADKGVFLIDRFTGKGIDEHTREIMNFGLVGMPYSRQYKLDRIIGFHYSAIGQSHFTSLADIIIGTFRFILNVITRDEKEKYPITKHLVSLLEPLFIKTSIGAIAGNSFFFSPKSVKVKKYRMQYQAIKDFFEDCGIKHEQEITGDSYF